MTKNNFSLRESLAQLEEIEEYFQDPDLDIDGAIGKYEEAMKLSQAIVAYLNEAETKIEKLTLP